MLKLYFLQKKEVFLNKLWDKVVDSYIKISQIIIFLNRWENPRKTEIFRNIYRILFIASSIIAVSWIISLINSIFIKDISQTINRIGIILQIFGTISVIPDLLREQDNINLKKTLELASENIQEKFRVKDLLNGKVFLFVEQDGVFGFINLICQFLFTLFFIFSLAPFVIIDKLSILTLVVTFLYYIVILLWLFFAVIYWGGKFFQVKLPIWIIATYFFLSLFLIPGVLLSFSIISILVFLLTEIFIRISRYPIRKIFIIITIPLILLGMILQLLVA